MTVHTLASVLAGIAFDPNIRGILVVLVAVIVLIGGPWLLLATNMGSRLGVLVTVAALSGWMVVMGGIWAAYGIGLVGELPSWTVKEVNVGDLTQAETEAARTAPSEDVLPAVDDLLAENPDLAASFDEGAVVRLGDVAAFDEDIIDDSEFDDWAVISQAELGEPQTAAEEALVEGSLAVFEEGGDYVVLRGFEKGGKPDREGDSVWDRVANKVTNTLQITHPTRYAVIQVQQSLPTEVPPGAAPLPAVPDPDEPVVSVVLVRNLGNLRLPPILFTLVFGALFALSAYLLHERDRAVMASRAAAG